MSYKSVLVISDLHIPYHHPDAFEFLKALKKKYKPDLVVNIGDEIDQHAISFHNHHPDLKSPGDELREARKYVKELEQIFPEMTLVHSNHSSLIYRKAVAHGLSLEYLKTYNEFLQVGPGCLINQKELAFEYAKNFKSRFIIGCGMIIEGQPKLMPMVLKDGGRWTQTIV